MSDFTVIGDIGETLKDLLDRDPWDDISSKPEITFSSPREIKDESGNSNKVSLFLYEVLENPYMRNQEPGGFENLYNMLPPLVVDLLYLVTPYSKDKTQEKYILGKVMQIFYNNSILTGTILHGSLSGSDERIKLLYQPMSLDDLTKIWTVFQDVGYRLSISYLVTPVKIDSTVMLKQHLVETQEMRYYQMVAKR